MHVSTRKGPNEYQENCETARPSLPPLLLKNASTPQAPWEERYAIIAESGKSASLRRLHLYPLPPRILLMLLRPQDDPIMFELKPFSLWSAWEQLVHQSNAKIHCSNDFLLEMVNFVSTSLTFLWASRRVRRLIAICQEDSRDGPQTNNHAMDSSLWRNAATRVQADGTRALGACRWKCLPVRVYSLLENEHDWKLCLSRHPAAESNMRVENRTASLRRVHALYPRTSSFQLSGGRFSIQMPQIELSRWLTSIGSNSIELDASALLLDVSDWPLVFFLRDFFLMIVQKKGDAIQKWTLCKLIKTEQCSIYLPRSVAQPQPVQQAHRRPMLCPFPPSRSILGPEFPPFEVAIWRV